MATSASLLFTLKSNSELASKNNSEQEAFLKRQSMILGDEIYFHKKALEFHVQKENLYQQKKNFFDKSIKALFDDEVKLHDDNMVFFEKKIHPLLTEKKKLHTDQKKEFKKLEKDFDDRKEFYKDETEFNVKRRRLLDKEREHLVERQKKLDEEYDYSQLMSEMLSKEADKLNKKIYRTLGDEDGTIFADGGLLENMELFKKDSQAYVNMVSQRFKDKMLAPFREAKATASALWNAGKFSFGFVKSLFRNTEVSGREGAIKLKAIQDSESEEQPKQTGTYYESKPSQTKLAPVPVADNVLKFQAPNYSVIAKTVPIQKSREESDSNISAKETEINSSADETANELEQKGYRSKVLEYLKIIAEKKSGTEAVSLGPAMGGGGFGLGLLDLFKKPINWFFNKVKGGFNWLKNASKKGFTRAKDLLSKAPSAIKNIGTTVFDKIKGTFKKIPGSASKAINSVSNVASKSLNAVKNIGSTTANLAKPVVNVVKNIGSTTANVASKVSNLAKPVMNVASKVASPVLKTVGAGLKAVPIVGTALGFALDAGGGAMKAKEWNTSTSSAVGASLIAGAGPSIDNPNASGFDKALSIGGNALKWGSVGGMIGGPVGAAVGALGGAVVAAIGGERIAKAIDWVKEKGGEAVEGVKNVAKKGLSLAKKVFIDDNPIVIGAKVLGNNLSAAKDKMKEGLKNVGGKLKDGVKAVGSFASNLFGSVTSFFSKKEPNEVKEPLKTLKDANLSVKTENKQVLTDSNTLKQGTLGAKIGSVVPGVGTVIGGAIGAGGGAVVEGVKNVTSKLKDGVKTVVPAAATILKEKISNIKETISEKINVAKASLSGNFDRVVETKDVVKNKLVNAGKSVLDRVSGFGPTVAGAIFGFGNKIKAFSDQVEAKKKSIFGQIDSRPTRFFGQGYDANRPENLSTSEMPSKANIDANTKPFVPEINVTTDFSLVKNKLSELEKSVYDNTNNIVSKFNSEASKIIEPKIPIEDLAIKIGTVIAKLINENNMKVIETLLEINTYTNKIAENTSKPVSVPVFYQQNKTDYLGYLRYKIPGLVK